MIRSFRDKLTEQVFDRERVRRFDPNLQRVAQRKLTVLDAAEGLDDLRQPPGNRLEKMRGERVGLWSIRINNQWRVCFRWRDGNAYEVEITDYH